MNTKFYIPPSSHLKEVFHSVWQVQGLTCFHNERIIPKGIIEIIFNFSSGSPMLGYLGDKPYRLPNCFISGFNRLPIMLQLPVEQTFFGVRLHPLAVKKILRTPACEFSDSIVDLTLLDSSFHSLWHQLACENNFHNRISIFAGWIEKKITGLQTQEKLINNFLSGNDRYDMSVAELARSLCYSPRQLSRKIAESTGMNTEEILLYKKYLHALHLIHHTDLSLTKIAYQSDFSDQSHFIKSFKTYTAMTPGEYKVKKGFIKGHIYENVR